MTYQKHYQSTAFYETYVARRDGEPVDEDHPIVFERNKEKGPDMHPVPKPDRK